MKKIIYSLGLLALVTACCPSRDEHLTTLAALHTEVYAGLQTQKADTSRINLLVSEYADYLKNFPDDSVADSIVYRAGSLQADMRKPSKAIEQFSNLLLAYPESEFAPKATLRLGDIYENQLADTTKAKEYYETFLKKYPTHPLAATAQIALSSVGETPAELLQRVNKEPNSSMSGVVR